MLTWKVRCAHNKELVEYLVKNAYSLMSPRLFDFLSIEAGNMKKDARK